MVPLNNVTVGLSPFEIISLALSIVVNEIIVIVTTYTTRAQSTFIHFLQDVIIWFYTIDFSDLVGDIISQVHAYFLRAAQILRPYMNDLAVSLAPTVAASGMILVKKELFWMITITAAWVLFFITFHFVHVEFQSRGGVKPPIIELELDSASEESEAPADEVEPAAPEPPTVSEAVEPYCPLCGIGHLGKYCPGFPLRPRFAVPANYRKVPDSALSNASVTPTMLQHPSVHGADTFDKARKYDLIPTRAESVVGAQPGTTKRGDSAASLIHAGNVAERVAKKICMYTPRGRTTPLAPQTIYRAIKKVYEDRIPNARFGLVPLGNGFYGHKYNTLHYSLYNVTKTYANDLGDYLPHTTDIHLSIKRQRDKTLGIPDNGRLPKRRRTS